MCLEVWATPAFKDPSPSPRPASAPEINDGGASRVRIPRPRVGRFRRLPTNHHHSTESPSPSSAHLNIQKCRRKEDLRTILRRPPSRSHSDRQTDIAGGCIVPSISPLGYIASCNLPATSIHLSFQIPSGLRSLPFIDASQIPLEYDQTTPESQLVYPGGYLSSESAPHPTTTTCVDEDSQQNRLETSNIVPFSSSTPKLDGSATIHQPIHQSQHSSYSELIAIADPILVPVRDRPRTDPQVTNYAPVSHRAPSGSDGPFDFPEADVGLVDLGRSGVLRRRPTTSVASIRIRSAPAGHPGPRYAKPSHRGPRCEDQVETKNHSSQRSDNRPSKPGHPHPYPPHRRHSQPGSAKPPAPDRFFEDKQASTSNTCTHFDYPKARFGGVEDHVESKTKA